MTIRKGTVMLTRRQARTLAAAAIGAATYLAGSYAGGRRIGIGALMTVAAGLLVNSVGTGTLAVQHRALRARYDYLINNGGSFGGTIYVNGDHHVTGDHTCSGTVSGGSLSSGGTVYFNDHNLSRVADINPGNEAWGARGALYMNGHDIWLGGATIHA